MPTNFDPKAMEALGKQMIQDGTMPPMDELEAALARIREEFGPKILAARQEDQESSSETAPSAEQRAIAGGTSSEGQTTGPKTRQAGNINRGWAKPDDPIYKEGWTISLGGLRGRSKTPTNSTPPQPDSQNQDQQGNTK
jgi:hypothetical protein